MLILTLNGGMKVQVGSNDVRHTEPFGAGCKVYVSGSKEPIECKESCDYVREFIKNKTGRWV